MTAANEQSRNTIWPAGVITMRVGSTRPCGPPVVAWNVERAGSASRRNPSATSTPGTRPASCAVSSRSDIRLPATNSESTPRSPDSESRSMENGRANRSSSKWASSSTRWRRALSKADSSGRRRSLSIMAPVSRSIASRRRPRPSTWPDEEIEEGKSVRGADICRSANEFATRAPADQFHAVCGNALICLLLPGIRRSVGGRAWWVCDLFVITDPNSVMREVPGFGPRGSGGLEIRSRIKRRRCCGARPS